MELIFLIIIGGALYWAYREATQDSGTNQNGSRQSTIPGFTGTIPDPAKATEPYIDDPTQSDATWWSESHTRYEEIRPLFIPGTVESYCRGGDIRADAGDHGAAIYFYRRSIDHMHTEYIFSEMAQRRPSPADEAPIVGYMRTLRKVRQLRPKAPIDEQVREVTHRLRTMSSAAERSGLPSDAYHRGLAELADITPHVNVSDIFW